MAYRDDAGEVCEAPTAEGTLRAELAPRHVKLVVANRSLEIVDGFATVIEHHRKHPARDRRSSFRISGRLVLARDVPRDGLGVWVELDAGGERAGFRRIFGVDPVSLLEPAGLPALGALDRLVHRVRHELGELAGDVRRALELGPSASGGLDKLLFTEHAAHCAAYVRRLFRDRARLVIEAHDDGRIVMRDGRRPGARATRSTLGAIAAALGDAMARPARVRPANGDREVTVRSRHGVIAAGDLVKLCDPQGNDLARIALPWVAFEDRVELARRLGERVDHAERDAAAWPPRLGAPGDGDGDGDGNDDGHGDGDPARPDPSAAPPPSAASTRRRRLQRMRLFRR